MISNTFRATQKSILYRHEWQKSNCKDIGGRQIKPTEKKSWYSSAKDIDAKNAERKCSAPSLVRGNQNAAIKKWEYKNLAHCPRQIDTVTEVILTNEIKMQYTSHKLSSKITLFNRSK